MSVPFLRECWLRRLGCALFWCPGRRVHGVWSHQVSWHFLGFLMLCFDFHRALPSFLTSAPHWPMGPRSSLAPVHLALCPAPSPWLLRITALLYFQHPVKLTTCVSFPCFGYLPDSLLISPSLPKWHTTLDYCLLSGALALGPWFLTSRCDSLYAPNVTI